MINFTRALLFAVNRRAKQDVFSASKVFSRFSSITTWNKDWKPGPYPRTEEEKIAAARKYNMLPEDYEPYPEEEGYGDYPMFPAVHHENLSSFKLYDNPWYKRNFGEPLHPDFDICLEDKVNFQKEHDPPLWKQFSCLFAFVALYSCLILYCEMNPLDHHQIPKQYPYRGVPSYTFEPVE